MKLASVTIVFEVGFFRCKRGVVSHLFFGDECGEKSILVVVVGDTSHSADYFYSVKCDSLIEDFFLC